MSRERFSIPELRAWIRNELAWANVPRSAQMLALVEVAEAAESGDPLRIHAALARFEFGGTDG